MANLADALLSMGQNKAAFKFVPHKRLVGDSLIFADLTRFASVLNFCNSAHRNLSVSLAEANDHYNF